jgi:hypothetical protein
MKFVGLTNNPDEIKKKHNDPEDWWQRSFTNKTEAKKWMHILVKNYGYKEITDDEGWKYGFTYKPQKQFKLSNTA